MPVLEVEPGEEEADYGFFSHDQMNQCGYLVYLTPEGAELPVTQVSSNPEINTGWADMQYVGRVIRRGGMLRKFDPPYRPAFLRG